MGDAGVACMRVRLPGMSRAAVAEGAFMTERDRIAEPWGSRTPYAAGDPWPERVDAFLEDGLSQEQVERWVPSASILHSNGDAMDIAVRAGRIVGVRGRTV